MECCVRDQEKIIVKSNVQLSDLKLLIKEKEINKAKN